MTLAADRMDIIVPSALLSHASDSRIPDWHKNILYRSVCCSMASSQTLFHSSVAVHNRWGLLLHVYFQVAETKFRHVIQLLFSYKLFCVVFDDPSDIRRILQYRARSQAPHFFNLTLSTEDSLVKSLSAVWDTKERWRRSPGKGDLPATALHRPSSP